MTSKFKALPITWGEYRDRVYRLAKVFRALKQDFLAMYWESTARIVAKWPEEHLSERMDTLPAEVLRNEELAVQLIRDAGLIDGSDGMQLAEGIFDSLLQENPTPIRPSGTFPHRVEKGNTDSLAEMVTDEYHLVTA